MDTFQYKCKNCGAPISFSAEDQRFICKYCESVFTGEDFKNPPLEEEFKTEPRDTEYLENMNEYRCSGCGAEIITDKNTSATFCMYCHAPVILLGRLKDTNKPSKIIPFQYSQQQAYDEYKKWIKKKWFLPFKYKNVNPENLKGIYVPFWLYSCNIQAETVCHCEDRKRIGKSTITRRYLVEKDGVFEFENLPLDGSENAENELLQSVEPYDYSKLVPFTMSYMSGFYSDKFDVDKDKAFHDAYKRISKGIDDTIENSINHQTVEITEHNYTPINIDAEYVLLPVWFMMNEYRGKKYYFAMNGETGKIAGILPLSNFKAITFALIMAILSLIIGFPLGLLFSWMNSLK